jgi:hypothetical protein
MALPEDIVAKVREDFGEDDGLLVLQELKNLQGEDDTSFGNRILRCIVALSKGSIRKFDQEIESAHRDWRDVIFAAEGWACNALIMNFPFPLHLDQALCRQWLTGQKIQLPWLPESENPWTIEASDIRKIELRNIKREDPEANDFTRTEMYQGVIKMLCARGQWVSTSPAFEIWPVIRYSVDLDLKQFTLKRMRYNPNEIKPRGIWEKE